MEQLTVSGSASGTQRATSVRLATSAFVASRTPASVAAASRLLYEERCTADCENMTPKTARLVSSSSPDTPSASSSHNEMGRRQRLRGLRGRDAAGAAASAVLAGTSMARRERGTLAETRAKE